MGMGKFGGRELGYASDIEVLFVYGGSGRTSGKQGIENSEFFERLAQDYCSGLKPSRKVSSTWTSGYALMAARARLPIHWKRSSATTARPDWPRRLSDKP